MANNGRPPAKSFQNILKLRRDEILVETAKPELIGRNCESRSLATQPGLRGDSHVTLKWSNSGRVRWLDTSFRSEQKSIQMNGGSKKHEVGRETGKHENQRFPRESPEDVNVPQGDYECIILSSDSDEGGAEMSEVWEGAHIDKMNDWGTSVTGHSTAIDRRMPVAGNSAVIDKRMPVAGNSAVIDKRMPVADNTAVIDRRMSVTSNSAVIDSRMSVADNSAVIDRRTPVADTSAVIDRRTHVTSNSAVIDKRMSVAEYSAVIDKRMPVAEYSAVINITQNPCSASRLSTQVHSGSQICALVSSRSMHDDCIDDQVVSNRSSIDDNIDDQVVSNRSSIDDNIDDQVVSNRSSIDDSIDGTAVSNRSSIDDNIDDQVVSNRSTHDDNIDDQVVSNRSSIDDSIDDTAVSNRSSIDDNIGDKAVSNRSTHDDNIDDQVVSNRSSIDDSIDDKAVSDRSSIDDNIGDKAVSKRSTHDDNIDDQVVSNRSSIDDSIDDKAVSDRSSIDDNIDDKAVSNRSSIDDNIDDKAADSSDDQPLSDSIKRLLKGIPFSSFNHERKLDSSRKRHITTVSSSSLSSPEEFTVGSEKWTISHKRHFISPCKKRRIKYGPSSAKSKSDNVEALRCGRMQHIEPSNFESSLSSDDDIVMSKRDANLNVSRRQIAKPKPSFTELSSRKHVTSKCHNAQTVSNVTRSRVSEISMGRQIFNISRKRHAQGGLSHAALSPAKCARIECELPRTPFLAAPATVPLPPMPDTTALPPTPDIAPIPPTETSALGRAGVHEHVTITPTQTSVLGGDGVHEHVTITPTQASALGGDGVHEHVTITPTQASALGGDGVHEHVTITPTQASALGGDGVHEHVTTTRITDKTDSRPTVEPAHVSSHSLEGTADQSIPYKMYIKTELPGEIIDVRGDGHCLIHAARLCLHYAGYTTTHGDLCSELENEVKTNQAFYINFSTDDEGVLKGIRRMIFDKEYNTDACDLVVPALSNATGTTITIYQDREETNQYDRFVVEPGRSDVVPKYTISLILRGEGDSAHYSALRPFEQYDAMSTGDASDNNGDARSVGRNNSRDDTSDVDAVIDDTMSNSHNIDTSRDVDLEEEEGVFSQQDEVIVLSDADDEDSVFASLTQLLRVKSEPDWEAEPDEDDISIILVEFGRSEAVLGEIFSPVKSEPSSDLELLQDGSALNGEAIDREPRDCVPGGRMSDGAPHEVVSSVTARYKLNKEHLRSIAQDIKHAAARARQRQPETYRVIGETVEQSTEDDDCLLLDITDVVHHRASRSSSDVSTVPHDAQIPSESHPEDAPGTAVELCQLEIARDTSFEPRQLEIARDTSFEPRQLEIARDTSFEPRQLEIARDTSFEPCQLEIACDTSVEPRQLEIALDTSFEPRQLEIARDTSIEPRQLEIARDTSFEPCQLEIARDTSVEPRQPEIARGTSFEPRQLEIARDTSFEPRQLEIACDTSFEPCQLEIARDTSVEPRQPEIARGTSFEPRQLEIARDTSFEPCQLEIALDTSFEPSHLEIAGDTSFEPRQLEIARDTSFEPCQLEIARDTSCEPRQLEIARDTSVEPHQLEIARDTSFELRQLEIARDTSFEPCQLEIARDTSIEPRQPEIARDTSFEPRQLEIARDTSFEPRQLEIAHDTSFEPRQLGIARDTSFEPRQQEIARDTSFEPCQLEIARDTSVEPHQLEIARDTSFEPRQLEIARDTSFEPHQLEIVRDTSFEPRQLEIARDTSFEPRQLGIARDTPVKPRQRHVHFASDTAVVEPRKQASIELQPGHHALEIAAELCPVNKFSDSSKDGDEQMICNHTKATHDGSPRRLTTPAKVHRIICHSAPKVKQLHDRRNLMIPCPERPPESRKRKPRTIRTKDMNSELSTEQVRRAQQQMEDREFEFHYSRGLHNILMGGQNYIMLDHL